ncbi:TIGR03087 family PEP-CTERM/XrtA system glycosyltransferase [Sphingomonas sp.]|jgi:sugar transferase (PEP-CTERM/EpsH1 system associated)|uniref:TIGR03087 family PEP-CTERM/XrtA system glycosyltransferase n=1 Tax=Sphingomonas sp. TaxID=28214 RepID=UPI002E368EB9|nr:TIGR03087 family PEP-CTERM/XrtA system glycosyltransferase [Sphingomonas sp.]HEX4693934.1 TIGR03087 family PEP-CTERM/XrtA system glycosyltransferase [Sphingomonas sp.]
MAVLFLAHRSPFPPDRGDKIRAYNILKYLAARTPVHLLAFADDKRDLDSAGLASLTASCKIVWRGKSRVVAMLEALASGKPASLTAFDSAEMRAAVADVLGRGDIDTIYVFSGQMAQYLPEGTRARVIMDFCDMDSLKFADYAKTATGPMRWLMQREADRLFAFERQVAGRVEASLFVSAAEEELFRARTRAAKVRVVENGIDTDFFGPAASFDAVDERGPLIVFTGQMDYRPNTEAVAWFARDVLPAVRAAHPQARFAIVGRNPGEAVRALAGEAVIVTGEVADVRGWLAAAACVVAPLKIARGVQNKVLEAMAMARPVVASDAAAEGIDHAGTIRCAHDAAAFAGAVIDLLDHAEKGDALGAKARARVRERYGWDARLAPLDALLGWPPAPARDAA